MVAPALGTGHFPSTQIRAHDLFDRFSFHRSLNELEDEVNPPKTYIWSSKKKSKLFGASRYNCQTS